MSISTRERALFAAVESVYNTAETLVGADVLEVQDLEPNPAERARLIERAIIRGSLNPEQAKYGGSLFAFSFVLELKASGVAGTAPRLGRLLRACGFDETIVAGTSVTYNPSSTLADHESVTIGFQEGPNFRTVRGCRGNVSWELTTGEYGRLTFNMVGHIESEAEAAAPTPDYEKDGGGALIVPNAFLGADFQIGGVAFPIESLSLDMQNTTSVSPDPNSANGYGDVRVTARNTQGSVNPEQVAISTKDFIGEFRSGATQAIQTGVIGSAGYQWALNVPNAYWREPSYGDREELLILELPFGAKDTDGTDEVSLQFT